MERTVRGRPGRLGRDLAAWRRASRSRCQRSTVSGAPAAGTGQARPVGAGAAGRPGTPGRPGRTAAGSHPAAAPAPRSGDVAPGSPALCPGRSPQAAAVTRTRSSHPDRQVEAAQPIIMPQQAGPSESNQLIRPPRSTHSYSPGRMKFPAHAPPGRQGPGPEKRLMARHRPGATQPGTSSLAPAPQIPAPAEIRPVPAARDRSPFRADGERDDQANGGGPGCALRPGAEAPGAARRRRE